MAALEAAFVGLESLDVPFITASILEFDRPIPLDALRAHIDAALADVPRYHQHVERGHLGGSAWVDDEKYRIAHHVATAVVAPPGEPGDLEALAAGLLSAWLPDGHSPWRVWTVTGLAGGRGAVIALFHHALVDGIAGFRLLEHVLRDPAIAAPARRPAPPADRGPLGRLLRWSNVRALATLLRDGLRPAAVLGLNPHRTRSRRIVASHTVELAAIQRIGRTFDATNNDVVLATVTSALRRFVTRRGVPLANLRDVRAMVPVGRHPGGAQDTTGNHVVLLLVPLPADAGDPVECLHRISTSTRGLKAGRSASAGELLIALSQITTPAVLTGVLRLALRMRAFNLIVTNIPGPKAPLSLLGARLTRVVPIVNLWPHQSLGVAVASYAGAMTFGLQADRQVIPEPELAQLRDDLAAAFDALHMAAQRAPATAPARAPSAFPAS